jgi:peptide/nickel transport system ATP-binding protein
MTSLLAIEELSVAFPGRPQPVEVVRRVSFAVERGEVVGLVGESGSGKSLTALAVLGLVPAPGFISSGRLLFAGEDLLALGEKGLRGVRGRRIAMVFQEPVAALNPVLTVGFQIAEVVRLHHGAGGREARRRAVELLDMVAMPAAARRLDDYPHQLSGGQCQRVMLAMALAGQPELLLADEPTTALDVTIQAEILALLERLRRQLGLAILLITHDLGVAAESCDRVVVMYAGEVVEEAPVGDLFAAPAHPYTRALLAASPRLGRSGPRGRLPAVPGRVPDPWRRPPGCAFHPRCGEVMAACREQPPPLFALGGRRAARCLLHADPR